MTELSSMATRRSLPAPSLDLSLSLPGIYFVGIFGSFGTGAASRRRRDRHFATHL